MKKIILILIIAILAFPMPAVYGADQISVLVNGKQVVSDVPAVNVSGNIMLPFRAIFNSLGVGDDSINWNQSSKSIEVRQGKTYLFLIIGNSGALVNEKMITLNASPFIENGRTYVPVRFVSEALGADVQWDGTTRTVTITKK
ncbi:MAG: copper amine oxidase N-terminal domain-containing protein [Eubacteriales bacterium]|nr:copper amine oxidase N-terminal domain-containing protein [Eubacteriales bacterium]